MQLFSNYDENDVQDTLIDAEDKINDLQESYQDLKNIFANVKNDEELYLRHLDNNDKNRQEFYEVLNQYLKNFSECMTLRNFSNDSRNIDLYRSEASKFMKLRKSIV